MYIKKKKGRVSTGFPRVSTGFLRVKSQAGFYLDPDRFQTRVSPKKKKQETKERWHIFNPPSFAWRFISPALYISKPFPIHVIATMKQILSNHCLQHQGISYLSHSNSLYQISQHEHGQKNLNFYRSFYPLLLQRYNHLNTLFH